MAKLSVLKGATSVLIRVFIQDSSSTTGAGLTGLAFNTSSLVCYRARDDDGNAGGTAITLATATLGTWASGGFKEKDATNMPGWYEFGVTNASLVTGSRSVSFMFKGATNMAQTPIEIELTGFDNQSVTDGGLSKLASLTFTVANQIDSNVLDWKSATAPAMTGDAFARLGAPAGASVSADIAAAKVDTAAIKVATDKLTFTVANQIDANVLDWKSATAPAMTGDAYARLGAPAGASVSADVAAVKVDTAAVKVKTDQLVFTTANRVDSSVIDKTGFAIGAGGIANAAFAADAISASKVDADVTAELWALACVEPTAVVSATPTMKAAISWLLTLSRNTITQTATAQILKADDTTTTIATSTISDDATTFTRGEFA